MAEPVSPTGPAGFNLFDNPAFLANPYAFYAMLRSNNPVLRPPIPNHEGGGVAVLTRFADVETALKDERFSVDRLKADLIQQFRDVIPADLLEGPQAFRSMLTVDAPEHTRLRGLVNKAFTPRMVEELRPRVDALVAECLDLAEEKGGLDVIHDLAEPLPAIVIAELLGVPSEDHREFKRMSSEVINRTQPRFLQPGTGNLEEATRGFEKLRSYMADVVAARRRAPQDDLISAMIAAQEDRDALTEAELISTALLLLIAGHETTTNLIGNGLLALMRNRGEWERLVAEPGLVDNAVEELLRYDSPVQATVRVTSEDVAIGGEPLRKGALAICLIGAANRDPEEFEDPDRLDVARTGVRHLSFGWGPHFCLGAGLARLEGRTAFRQLTHRFPDLELTTDDVSYRPNPFLRGLEKLEVTV